MGLKGDAASKGELGDSLNGSGVGVGGRFGGMVEKYENGDG
ncbi:hypothetical protein [Staphylococcus haemolyticus]|nr:hypothetical protein [Staphylococcus haemolyticus]